jgi:hypothetical protein
MAHKDTRKEWCMKKSAIHADFMVFGGFCTGYQVDRNHALSFGASAVIE